MISNFDFLINSSFEGDSSNILKYEFNIDVFELEKKKIEIHQLVNQAETFAYLDVFKSCQYCKDTIELILDFFMTHNILNYEKDDSSLTKILNEQFHIMFGTTTVMKLVKILNYTDEDSIGLIIQYLYEFIIRFCNIIDNQPLRFDFNNDVLFQNTKLNFQYFNNYQNVLNVFNLSDLNTECYFDNDSLKLRAEEVKIDNLYALKGDEDKMGNIIITFNYENLDYCAFNFYQFNNKKLKLCWQILEAKLEDSNLLLNNISFKKTVYLNDEFEKLAELENENKRYIITNSCNHFFYNLESIYKVFKFKISKINTRFFYAKPIEKTWPKLFILTLDGLFYSEYLHYNKISYVEEQFDFFLFNESDYIFGGYQSIKEISKDEALSFELIEQENWVKRFLLKNNL